MSLLDYLNEGLIDTKGLRDALQPHVAEIAQAWRAEHIEPAGIELVAEMLARWASNLSDAAVSGQQLVAGVLFLTPAKPVLDLIEKAGQKPLRRVALAGLAVHLVDIAERLALEIYVPELPALHAKSDRTGDAARHVGVARHLKG